MGQRVDLSTVADEPVEDVPGRSAGSFSRMRVDRLAPTPLNPRENYGTEEELTDFGESLKVRQLQPVVVVSRAAYLKLWPDHAKEIGSAAFVIANGERRWRASRHVELPTIDAIVRDSIAESRPSFLDAVLKENIDRKNLDPIEEAQAVEAMVQECGSAGAAAKQFKRHESWVSQRRALLKLTPELQEQVRAGSLPVRLARSIAIKPATEQEPALRALEEQQQQERAAKRARKARSSATDAERTEAGVPQPRDEEAPGKGVRGSRARAADAEVPWDSTEKLAAMIRDRLTGRAVADLVRLLQA
ncbi:ParB/RepB/Spo0J family partition protein [Actinomadura sp. NPDC048394]|uniref:ParB/RepB/Spo0J family partition protein n=1 Tax=Actinomadura sp. NPDC048394 TaxID=3158223 RepID=UPI0033DBDC15